MKPILFLMSNIRQDNIVTFLDHEFKRNISFRKSPLRSSPCSRKREEQFIDPVEKFL